jgi:hypothetical protein
MTQLDVGCISSQQAASNSAPQNPHSRSRPVAKAQHLRTCYTKPLNGSPFRDHPPRAAGTEPLHAECHSSSAELPLPKDSPQPLRLLLQPVDGRTARAAIAPS